MPLQTEVLRIPPSLLTDTSSDFPVGCDSSIDQKSGERCLKLVEDRIVSPLSVPDHQLEIPSGVHVGRFSLKTENVFLASKTRISQHPAAGFSIQKLSVPKTYSELYRNNYIAILVDLNSLAFPEPEPTGAGKEEEVLLLENMPDEPAATPVNQSEIAHAEFGEKAGRAEKEQQDISGEMFSAELAGILGDLREVAGEAREEGFPIPSETAMTSSERLIRQIYGISPGSYGVYPTPDGEVAIDIFNGEGSSVILLCDSEGGVLCLVNIEGNRRRAHYSRRDTLPDGFVREALTELNL